MTTAALSIDQLTALATVAVKAFILSGTDTMAGRENWDFALIDVELADGRATATLLAQHKTEKVDTRTGDALKDRFQGRMAPVKRKAKVSCTITDAGSLRTPMIEVEGREVEMGSEIADGWLAL